MNDKELIGKLRHCATCEGCYVCEHQADDQCLKELIRTSADRISDLLAELQDEKHRHDRYVDFELAQAEELRKLKEENRWIPVSERKPDREWMEYGEQTGRILEVIVKIAYADRPTILHYDGHDGFYDCGDDGEKSFYPVSHWKLLPENPEE